MRSPLCALLSCTDGPLDTPLLSGALLDAQLASKTTPAKDNDRE